MDVNPFRMNNRSKLQSGLGSRLALIIESTISLPLDGFSNQLQDLIPFSKTIVPEFSVSVELQGVTEINQKQINDVIKRKIIAKIN